VTRVAVIAESPRVRRELSDIVRASPVLELVGAAAAIEDLDVSSIEAADAIDVLVIEGPHAGALTEEVSAAVVSLSDDAETFTAPRAQRAGLALLPTRATAEQIIAAIGAVAQGLFVTHADLVNPPPRVVNHSLTPREHEVLQMLAAGLGNKAIGSRLGISEHTAKFHVAQILAKLDAGSRAEAVSIAMRRGLVPL
jgi:two-component system, NarL family, response regulator YdfI